jgi:hypothetical protein
LETSGLQQSHRICSEPTSLTRTDNSLRAYDYEAPICKEVPGRTPIVSTNSNAHSVLFDPDRIHKTTVAYKDLLDFVIRLRNFARFNAMLLQVQKPGLTYAASTVSWLARFDRKPKDGARPLLIL